MEIYTLAIFSIIFLKISMPSRYILAGKYSLFPCKKGWTLDIGEKPKAGIPNGLINLQSVAPAQIIGTALYPLKI
jgi:hypothetical protein